MPEKTEKKKSLTRRENIGRGGKNEKKIFM